MNQWYFQTYFQRNLKTAVLMAAISFAHNAGAQHVSNVEAAQLAVHRIDKLIQIKKIDAGFDTKLKGLTFENLKQDKETDPAYKTTAFQYPAEDKTAKAVEIFQDHKGKALRFEKIDGADATGFPEWPEAKPLTFLENTFHYVEENAETIEELVPYRDGLRTVSLEPVKDADDKDVALVSIAIDDEEKLLRVTLNLKGEVVSYKIEKPDEK